MKEKFKQPAQAIRLWFWLFAAACLIAAFIMPDRDQMFEGMLRLSALFVPPFIPCPAASRTVFLCLHFS